jgi:hypothetical protein
MVGKVREWSWERCSLSDNAVESLLFLKPLFLKM